MRVRINGFAACSATAFAAVAVTAAVAAAQPPPVDGIVQVAAGEDGDAARLGFIADDRQHVVAGIETLRADLFPGKEYTVRTAAGDEYPARGVAYDEATALALLRVEGSPTPGYPFARDPVAAERRVYGATRMDGELSMRAGSVSGIEAAGSIMHNVLVGPSGYGSPLFNNCGEVSGAMVGRAAELVEEPNAALAVSAAWLERVFGPHGLAVRRTGAECVSDAVQAAAARNLMVETEEPDPADDAPEEVEPRREAEAGPPPAAQPGTASSAPTARSDPPAAEARADSSAAAGEPRIDSSAPGVEARADSSAATGETGTDPSGGSGDRAGGAGRRNDERNPQVVEEPVREPAEDPDAAVSPGYWVSAVVAGIALPVLMVLVWLGRRSLVKESPVASAAPAPPEGEEAVEETVPSWRDHGVRGDVPDVLFTGADREGRQVALRVPGVKIAESAGAVVGRNPLDAAVVLYHEEVSRRHFRLFVENGGLMIEDLGSMNGTEVGGVALPPGSGRALRDGERLTVGSLSFTTKFVPSGT